MTERVPAAIAALLSLVLAIPAAAQTGYEPLEPLPLGATLLSLPSPHVAAAGLWEAKFSHRFAEADGAGFRTLWGLDGGANVTMGLSYVPARDLELSIVRSNVLDTWEAAGKYVVVQQAPAIPLSLTLRGGIDVRTERDLEDRLSPFVQLILARRVTPRLELFALPSWVRNAGRATAGETSYALFRDAFNVPLGAAFSIRDGLSLVAEVIPSNRDLTDEGDPGWSVGIKKAIGGHHFEVLLTNDPGTTADQYLSSTHLGAPLETGGVRIGFNIERQFGRPRTR